MQCRGECPLERDLDSLGRCFDGVCEENTELADTLRKVRDAIAKGGDGVLDAIKQILQATGFAPEGEVK